MSSSSFDSYFNYHLQSAQIGDIDPQNDVLKYICNRFELNIEQRYWLAYLFGTCYCAPTVYYIYNEFPDFETVNLGRLKRWWVANKKKCKFQTDRLKIQTMDKFVESFESYKSLIGTTSQADYYKTTINDPILNYKEIWKRSGKIKNFGRFSQFIYIELLHELCGLKIMPDRLDVANAESCRNGILYAIGKEELCDTFITSKSNVAMLEAVFLKFVKQIRQMRTHEHMTVTPWSVETSLCAYKKHRRGKRWVGYYLDRMHDEIKLMEERVPDGVCWDVLWEMRSETYNHAHLPELTGKNSSFEEPYEGYRNNW